MPEGLSVDLWNKLVELRERKIASERECRMAYNRFQEMQTLVQAVLDESERIRNETEKLTSDLNQFLEYKFHNTYNVESLFELKQGQVKKEKGGRKVACFTRRVYLFSRLKFLKRPL